jgi:hypothetical protein
VIHTQKHKTRMDIYSFGTRPGSGVVRRRREFGNGDALMT